MQLGRLRVTVRWNGEAIELTADGIGQGHCMGLYDIDTLQSRQDESERFPLHGVRGCDSGNEDKEHDGKRTHQDHVLLQVPGREGLHTDWRKPEFPGMGL